MDVLETCMGEIIMVITTTVECKCKSYFAAFAVLRANQLCFFLECAFVLGGTA